MQYSVRGGKWDLPAEKLAEYKATYATLDVDAQLRLAWQWLEDNPQKRKTERGMPRFLNSWLSRAAGRQAKYNGWHVGDTNEWGLPNEVQEMW
jgi:hypothetical protein